MRRPTSSFLASLVLGTALLARADGGGDWSPVLDEKGLKGYARSVPGSDILEFRSTVVLAAPIELIGEILRDVEGLKRSSKSCKEARILDYQDRNHYTFYVAYALPFPLDDRDVVIRVATTYDFALGRAVTNLAAVDSPKMPPRKDHVRITDLRAQFVFQYLGRDKTGIVYTHRTNPGGHIPDFLVNYSNKKSLKSSVEDLRSATHNPTYQAAAAKSEDHALVEGILKDGTTLATILRNRLAEFIHDGDFVDLLTGEPGVMSALLAGDGVVGETLLHGFGARSSQRRAVAELLRRYLAGRGVDGKSVEAAAKDEALLNALLDGGGAPRVRALLSKGGA